MEPEMLKAKQNYAAGKYRKAAEQYRMILASEPDNAVAHQGLAQCLNRLGYLDEAAQECNRALELNPKLAIPYAVLGGSIYLKQRSFKKSEAALRQAIRLDSRIEETHISLGAVLIEQGRFQEAVEALQTALELNPYSSLAHYNLAIAYARQEHYSKARREATQAFRFRPSVQTGRNLILTVLVHLAEEHRILHSFIIIGVLLLPLVTSSPLVLVFAVPVLIYLIWGVVNNLRTGRRRQGIVLLVSLLAIVALYLYQRLYVL